jgi:hypothetical protein
VAQKKATSPERLDRPNSKNNQFKVHSVLFQIMYALMPTQAIEIVPIEIPKKVARCMQFFVSGPVNFFGGRVFSEDFFDTLYDLDDHETLHNSEEN